MKFWKSFPAWRGQGLLCFFFVGLIFLTSPANPQGSVLHSIANPKISNHQIAFAWSADGLSLENRSCLASCWRALVQIWQRIWRSCTMARNVDIKREVMGNATSLKTNMSLKSSGWKTTFLLKLFFLRDMFVFGGVPKTSTCPIISFSTTSSTLK